MTIQQLKAQHPCLTFASYHYQLHHHQLELEYQFILDDAKQTQPLIFKPRVILPDLPPSSQEKIHQNQELFERLVFNLGLAELPSYWKAACAPEIKITAGQLSTAALSWWHDLLIKGLGEFYYVNQIDFSQPDFVKLTNPAAAGQPSPQPDQPAESNQSPKLSGQPNLVNHTANYLVPIGGGKDSTLTIEILKKSKKNFGCLLLEPESPAAQLIAQQSQAPTVISLQRQIDPLLIKLNQQGYLNGHTPFSAYLAFASTLTAWLYDFTDILVANERSANEGNQLFHGHLVNHQYSKTFTFEQKFRDYAKQELFANLPTADLPATNLPANSAPYPNYLSFLRPIWEIQIAKAFAQYPQYFSLFKSCNVNQKQNSWCHHCPKCLFVFIMLSPFVDWSVLTQQIFQSDLFTDASLVSTALELAGLSGQKPFDCVGTYQETQAALYLAIEKFHATNGQTAPLPIVLQTVATKLEEKAVQENTSLAELKLQAEKLLTDWHEEHFLSPELTKLLKQEIFKN